MKTIKIINDNFQKAMMKLSEQNMPLMTAKKVLDTLRQIKDESDKYNKKRIKLLTDCAEKNDKDEAVKDENGNFVLAKDKVEEFNTKITEMMNKEVALTKLSMKHLSEAKLTAQEFSLLEDLIS